MLIRVRPIVCLSFSCSFEGLARVPDELVQASRSLRIPLDEVTQPCPRCGYPAVQGPRTGPRSEHEELLLEYAQHEERHGRNP